LPHKERKKIIKIDQASFGVILPRVWLQYYDLDDKDQIELVSNGVITIKPMEGD